MSGVSWHPGCPVSLSRLRILTLTYLGFDGRPHTGRIVVNADVARSVVSVFRRLYAAGYPIRLGEEAGRGACTTTSTSR